MQGWKTLTFGLALVMLGVLQSTEVNAFISAHPGSVSTAVGLIVVVLRVLTTTPVLTKTDTSTGEGDKK